MSEDKRSNNEGKKLADVTAIEKAREDGWKLLFDMYKHITTLSTGSILILVALLEKLFTNPQWKGLAIIAFGLFVLSIISAVYAMASSAHFVKNFSDIKNDPRSKVWNVSDELCALGFIAGIVCVVIFAIKNLYA